MLRQLIILLGLSVLFCSCEVTEAGSQSKSMESASAKRASMGMGLNKISDWSTQMPFLDLMKQSREWKDWNTKDKQANKIKTDQNDWVTSLLPDQAAGTVFLTSPKDREPLYKTYIVDYQGQGSIEYRWSAKLVKRNNKLKQDVIEVGPGSNLLEIVETDSKDPIRNISIVPEKHYAAYKSGTIFNPDWLKLIKEFNTLRYMDWLQTNNSELTHWADRTRLEHRTWKAGVPYEVIIALASLTNTNVWLNLPHLADQNFIEETAGLFKTKLPSHLKIYVEHSNEVWNRQFRQAKYADVAGRKVFGQVNGASMRWHGMKTAQICDTFKVDVFKQEQDRVRCVLGVHTGYQGLEKNALLCEGWQGAKQKACYKHGIDHIAITTYFSGKLNGPSRRKPQLQYRDTLLDWAERPDGLDFAFKQLQTGEPLKQFKPFKKNRGVIAELENSLKYWSTTAKKYGLTLVAYEGGQHLTASGKELQNNQGFNDFHRRINDDPRMGELYGQLLNTWKAAGGDLHVHYLDVAESSKWGSWGARRFLDVNAPKWQALDEFNQKHACWWEDCEIPPRAKH